MVQKNVARSFKPLHNIFLRHKTMSFFFGGGGGGGGGGGRTCLMLLVKGMKLSKRDDIRIGKCAVAIDKFFLSFRSVSYSVNACCPLKVLTYTNKAEIFSCQVCLKSGSHLPRKLVLFASIKVI